MTSVIINDVLPRSQFTATSGQTVFDTNWTVDSTSDVVVYARASGVPADDDTQLVSTVDYNVTLIGAQETVRVTFLSGRTVGDIITIIRATPFDRVNIYTNSNFTPSMLNGDFARTVLWAQQNELDRGSENGVGVRYNYSEEVSLPRDQILPILEAREAWRMNSSRTAIETFLVPDGDLAPGDATYLIQTADADLPNAQVMASLATGFVFNTTSTGVQNTRTFLGTSSEIVLTNGNGAGGNPQIGIADNPILPGTGSMTMPKGTTAERPGVPVNGMTRYNTDTHTLEVYENGSWDSLSGGVVDSVVGTANQIDVDNTDPANPILSLATTLIAPGTVQVGNLLISGNTISSVDTDGNIILTPDGNGNVVLSSNITVQDGVLFDINGDTILSLTETSAGTPVAWLDIKNSAGANPSIRAMSSGSNCNVSIEPLGDGALRVFGTSTTSAGIQLREQTANGTEYIQIKAPSAIATSFTLTLPNALPAANNSALLFNTAGVGSYGVVPTVSTPTTDNAIARFNGTGGAIQNSGVTIDDSDVVSGITLLNVDNLRLDGNTLSTTDTNGNFIIAPNGTGQVHIANEGAVLRIQDTAAAGVTANPRLDFYDSSARLGYVGFGSVANNNIFLLAEAGNAISLRTNGNNERLNISSAGIITANNRIDADAGVSFNTGTDVLNEYTRIADWTPTLQGSGTAGSPTGTFNGKFMNLNDDLVWFSVQAVFTDLDTMAGNLQIAAFPEAAETGAAFRAGVSVAFRNNWTNDFVYTGIFSSSTVMTLYNAGVDNTPVAITDLSATTNIYLSGIYVKA
jgi:hypothetical protein